MTQEERFEYSKTKERILHGAVRVTEAAALSGRTLDG